VKAEGHPRLTGTTGARPETTGARRALAPLRENALVDFAYRFYWVEHGAPDLAAGIAFRLLINLFPLFGAVGTIVALLLRDPAYAAQVLTILFRLFPESWAEQLPALYEAGQNAGALGILSSAVLFWFGTTLLESLGHAFFRHYGKSPRRTIRLRAVGFVIIVALAIVLLATVLAASLASQIGAALGAQFGVDQALWHLLLQLATSLTGYVLAFVLLMALYWIIPNVGLRPRDVWPGALLAATLFAGALQLYPLYLRFRPATAGGAAFSFVFLVTTWLYLLAHIVLLGNALNAYRLGYGRR
jgi:membrane protein